MLLFPVSSGSLSFPIVRYETMLVVDTVCIIQVVSERVGWYVSLGGGPGGELLGKLPGWIVGYGGYEGLIGNVLRGFTVPGGGGGRLVSGWMCES